MPNEKQESRPHNYALIIGVDDYTSFAPDGSEDLKSGVNSALAWLRVCVAEGIPVDNIRLLTAPPLGPKDLPKGCEQVSCGRATEKEIQNGVKDFLSKKLAGPDPASGLAVFIGHGLEAPDGHHLLCPSDLDPELEKVIDAQKLCSESMHGSMDSLTLVFDSCYTAVGGEDQSELRRSLVSQFGTRDLDSADSRLRVISASKQGAPAYTDRFGGQVMGAFSWAATSVISFWTSRKEEGVRYVDISHNTLKKRVEGLLGSFPGAFPQVTTLSGPEGVGQMAFLQPALDGKACPTSIKPTFREGKLQLDGGIIRENCYSMYTIKLEYTLNSVSDNTVASIHMNDVLAIVLVTSTSGDKFPSLGQDKMKAGTEYWLFKNTPDSALSWIRAASNCPCLRLDYGSVNFTPQSNLSSPVSDFISDLGSSNYKAYEAAESGGWSNVPSMTSFGKNDLHFSISIEDNFKKLIKWSMIINLNGDSTEVATIDWLQVISGPDAEAKNIQLEKALSDWRNLPKPPALEDGEKMYKAVSLLTKKAI